jgi:hypothetical protein
MAMEKNHTPNGKARQIITDTFHMRMMTNLDVFSNHREESPIKGHSQLEH